MDGNGRWAQARGKPRTFGHEEGLKAARRVVEAASKQGVDYLTLYVFSTENWKRARTEVDFIMGLVKRYLRGEFEFYKANGIRIRHAGDLHGLGKDVAAELLQAMEETKHFTGMQVVLALNYGGRDEIIRAARKIHGDITETAIERHLDNPDIPDVDLIIRTGDEQRISNFLLWEGAYAELYFSPKMWPDWTGDDLAAALEDYRQRKRRFGSA
jgi:undecaprenyl diphosphate synthase